MKFIAVPALIHMMFAGELMFKILRDNKGFIFIEVLFLTLILSFTTLMVYNSLESAIKSNKMSAIRIAAIHIANARMTEIEEYNINRTTFQMPAYTFLTDDDLICENFFGINGTVKFKIDTQINESSATKGNVTVIVSWTVNDNSSYGNGDNYEQITKDIWIIPAAAPETQS